MTLTETCRCGASLTVTISDRHPIAAMVQFSRWRREHACTTTAERTPDEGT